ncbi:hypothetical protein ACLOJK_005415 [Asimina triloba]
MHGSISRGRSILAGCSGAQRLAVGGLPPILQARLLGQFTQIARTHGRIMSVRIGAKLCVVLSSPDAAKKNPKDHDATFANRVPGPAGDSDIGFNYNGPKWRMLQWDAELLGVPNISDLFPIVAWLDIQGVVRRMKRLSKCGDRLYDSIIDRRNMRMRLDGAAGEKVKSKNFFCRLRLKKTPEGQ